MSSSDSTETPTSTPPECHSLSSSADSSSAPSSTPSLTKLPVVERRYVRSGIGGAGNYHKVDPSKSSSPSFMHLSISRCKRSFTTGIGGAGNRVSHVEVPELSSTEKLARAKAQEKHATDSYHVGIGGTGNRAKRLSYQTFQSSAPLVAAEPKPELQYSDQPLRLGAADRLAAKLAQALPSRFSLRK